MVKKIRRKVKKIAMKASLVSMELQDLSEENREQKEMLSKDFSNEFEFLEWRKRKNNPPEANAKPTCNKDGILEIEKPDAPLEIKKLYRSIATKTHPDKVKDQELNDLFQEALVAMEEENWMLLVEIAGELKLDIDFLSDETCLLIEESIARNEKEIQSIKNSFSYIWANKKTEKDKELFTMLFYKQFKIDVQEFNQWLKERKDKKS